MVHLHWAWEMSPSSETQCTIQFEVRQWFSVSLRLILPCSYMFWNVQNGDTEAYGYLLDLRDARLDILLLFALPSSSSTTGTTKIEPWFYLPSCLNFTLLYHYCNRRDSNVFIGICHFVGGVGGSVHLTPWPSTWPQPPDHRLYPPFPGPDLRTINLPPHPRTRHQNQRKDDPHLLPSGIETRSHRQFWLVMLMRGCLVLKPYFIYPCTLSKPILTKKFCANKAQLKTAELP